MDKFTLLMSYTAASAFSLLRQARITLAPLLARSKAVVLPIPVLLPATTTEFAYVHVYINLIKSLVSANHSFYHKMKNII